MTPSTPALRIHVPHERFCQSAKSDKALPLPAAFSPAGKLAGRLATKLTGALPLLFHPSEPSGVNRLSAVTKNSTRGFQNAGKSVQKTGK